MAVQRVIFHDVPRHARGQDLKPLFAEAETEVDAPRKAHLKTRLTRVINSSNAYAISFRPGTTSAVPAEVRPFTRAPKDTEDFVAMSQKLAQHLFELQHGSISAGLLCVIEVVSASRAGLVLMKLEREEGARLELKDHAGKRAFDMSVLDNLVLTDGTRLFKTAMFIRVGEGDDDFVATACDSQWNVTSSEDMAKFWLRFLGCTLVVEPRVATERFYEATLTFINDTVVNPVHKNDVYEHLQSQLKSARRDFSPRNFMENYVPSGYRNAFQEHLTARNVPLTRFTKDLADIKARLRRKAYRTKRGAVISVPIDENIVVEVKREKVVVNDPVDRVDKS